jgi:predicted MFS family arabinose efflux permease
VIIATLAPKRTQDEAHATGAVRWYALGLLTCIAVLYGIDRTLVLALAEPIKREFRLSDADLGLLTSLFAISYSVAGIPVGLLVDRANRICLLAALVVGWSCMTGLSGLARSFPMLILARLGLAAGESGAVPTSLSLIADYFPPERRGTALGVFFFNNAISSLLGFSMAGAVALHFGWRAAFFVAGAPGIALGFLFLATLREPLRGRFEPLPRQEPTRASVAAILRVIGSRPALKRLTIAAIAIIAIQAGTTAFLSPFFIRVHHLSVEQAGFLIGGIFGAGFAIGTPAGGLLSDWLSAKSPRGSCLFLGGLSLAACPCALAGLMAGNLAVAAIALFIYMTLIAGYYPAAFSTFLNLSPPPMRGALGAFLMVMMNLAGYGAGPQFVGFCSDFATHLGLPDPLRWALVLLECGLLPAGLLFLAAGRRIGTAPAQSA